ncbi:hypothetical protein [Neomegalonema sp.]|uniref:hypothetical protein n=1 Tax=Neomegalonema sp. TaxID=2039713 RepID=UPI00260DC2C0|nr:hypothetical protein [Neomegalonema sp.]MDD2868339.1 hypothetical protein [Neomegalonema sp.]
MIRLTRVTFEPKVNALRRSILRNASFRFEHPRMAVLHADPQERGLLADLLVGQKMPVSGRVDWAVEPSWPIGQARFLQLELTGWQNLTMIADLYHAPARAARLALEPFDHMDLMDLPLRRWLPAARLQFAYCLGLAPEFGSYVLHGALAPPGWRSYPLWARRFGERVAHRQLIVLTPQAALLPKLNPVHVGVVEGRFVLVTDPQAFLRGASLLPDEERPEEPQAADDSQNDPFL